MMRSLLLIVVLINTRSVLADDWPQWRGPKRDGIWRETGLPDRWPASGLKPRWRQAIGGGYGGVAVVGSRVYVMDRRKQPREVERIVCLDAASGKTIWTHSYPVVYGRMEYGNGPRGTPTVHAGRVYTFGALGHLHCLDAADGRVVWVRDTVKDFKGRVPTWGHACSPLVDGEQLIVQVGGQPEACLIALDRVTGKEIWRSLADRPGYSSPVLIETKEWRQLVYFTPEHVVGLEPATGRVRWRMPFPGITYDVSISDVVWTEGVLLASNYWSGSRAIRLDERGLDPSIAWEGKQLSLLMSTPLVRDGHVYALDRHRGLKCLNVKTGEVLWDGEYVTPRGSNPQASLVWAGDNALILNERGELVLAELSPKGCRVLGKTPILGATWAHPAYANGCIFARNDDEIVCVPLTSSAK